MCIYMNCNNIYNNNIYIFLFVFSTLHEHLYAINNSIGLVVTLKNVSSIFYFFVFGRRVI